LTIVYAYIIYEFSLFYQAMTSDTKLKAELFQIQTDSPGWLLWELTHLWKRKLEEELEQYDLTAFQLMLLRGLMHLASKDKKSTTQVDLANLLRSNKMMTSNVLRTLETKGLIKREAHPTDTRAKVLVLTSAGITLGNQAIKELQKLNKEFFGDDSQDFTQVIKKLIIKNQEN
jgi:MarR family transcriptional regulator, organic hydroperoxide resistance regulator